MSENERKDVWYSRDEGFLFDRAGRHRTNAPWERWRPIAMNIPEQYVLPFAENYKWEGRDYKKTMAAYEGYIVLNKLRDKIKKEEFFYQVETENGVETRSDMVYTYVENARGATEEGVTTAVVETITPEKAAEYLKSNTSNRPLRKPIVDFYTREMAEGRWKLNGESICFTADGGLANGQHRLHAVIKSGATIRAVVVRGCAEGSFATYDSGLNRKASDVFYSANIKGSLNISTIVRKVLTLRSEGAFVSSSAGDLSSMKTSKQRLLEVYWKMPKIFNRACGYARQCYKKMRIFKVSEIGGLYVYLLTDGGWSIQTVERFFDSLFDIEDRSVPATALLRERIIREQLNTVKTFPREVKQALLIKAWNYYVSGTSTKALRYIPEQDAKAWFKFNKATSHCEKLRIKEFAQEGEGVYDEQVAKMRLQGKTIREIAGQLGVDKGKIERSLKRILKQD